MSLIVGIVVGLCFIPPVLVFLFIFLHRKSFKHPAIIIKKVGDTNVITNDRFRVRKQHLDKNTNDKDEDVMVIEFLKSVKTKSLVPEFKLWNRFWTHKKKDVTDSLELPEKVIRNSIKDGALFYMPTPGEIKAVTLDKVGNLTVLDQDNRNFIATQMMKKNSFMARAQSNWVQIAMVLGPIFLVLMIILVMWIIFNTQMTENISAICSQAKTSAGSFADTVRGVAG